MTRLKFLQSISGSGSPDLIQHPNFYFPVNFVGEIVDDLAEAWVAGGIAEYAEPHVKNAPPEPEFAAPVSPEVAIARVAKASKGKDKPTPPVEDKKKS